MLTQKHLKTAILTAFAVETISITWCLKIPGGSYLFTILYFIAGISFAGLLLFFPELKFPTGGIKAWNTRPVHYKFIIIGLLALAMYTLGGIWFDDIPVDISYADMLPIIKVMCQRFAAGLHREVYDNIPWIWNGIQPIYLPAMWLPFVPATVLGFDMRWITVAGLLFAFSVFILIYRPERKSYQSFLLGVLAFLLFWWIFADDTPGVITVSEEGVVAAYYTLLVLALISGKPLLTGIATSLCMLSRYALIGWVPAFLLYLLLQKKIKQSVIFIITGILCFVLLFLLPVGWDTFVRLALLPGNYIKFAGIVWHDSPEVFSKGLGFAGFFGPRRIALLHRLLIILSFVVPALFILFCYYRSKKGKIANIPLATLKISVVIFYCFIDVPYMYLFYTSSFISLITIAMLFRNSGPAPNPVPDLVQDPAVESGSK